MSPEGPAVRIVRVIARLNVGGPAIQALALTRHLQSHGYRTVLVRGREERDEGNMDHLADELGVRPVFVPWLRRNPGWHDLLALFALVRIMRRERPHIVHTHAAKGGTLGRVAAVLAFPWKARRPILVHTYHGHSLTGYFQPRTAAIYRRIEQVLAFVTQRLVAVSDEVRDDLIALRVAPAAKFDVIRLGFDLTRFTAEEGPSREARLAFRAELGIPSDAVLVTLIARLVPIKRVDRFLAVATALKEVPGVWFLIAGDGELREQLVQSPASRALGERVVWAGFRRDMASVLFASDVVVQTSDNEGTPVALIEAQAAGRAVVSTDVGGTRTVVVDGQTGYVVPVDDPERLADSVRALLADPELAAGMGRRGRQRVLALFSSERLLADVDRLYRDCLADRATRSARERGRPLGAACRRS